MKTAPEDPGRLHDNSGDLGDLGGKVLAARAPCYPDAPAKVAFFFTGVGVCSPKDDLSGLSSNTTWQWWQAHLESAKCACHHCLLNS